MLTSAICSIGKKSSNEYSASPFVPKQLSILKLCSDNNVKQLAIPKAEQTLIRISFIVLILIILVSNIMLVFSLILYVLSEL